MPNFIQCKINTGVFHKRRCNCTEADTPVLSSYFEPNLNVPDKKVEEKWEKTYCDFCKKVINDVCVCNGKTKENFHFECWEKKKYKSI